MKKRGFTLIELLAVIVILAIIALIATPIVMNVIENARKGAAERSAENYLSAAETALAMTKLDNTVLKNGVYTVDENGNLVNGKTVIEVEVTGDKPEAGSIVVIEDYQILDGSILKINDSVVNVVDGKMVTGTYATYSLDEIKEGKAIKYDPILGDVCTEGETCYNWYVLEDKGEEYAYVTLLLDRNLGNDVNWVTLTDYELDGGDEEEYYNTSQGFPNVDRGPLTAMKYLQSLTSDWKNKASLPSAEQIAIAGGMDELSYEVTPLSEWIGSNLEDASYWTTTTDDGQYVWDVWRDNYNQAGQIMVYLAAWDDASWQAGVRPTIMVSKNLLQ